MRKSKSPGPASAYRGAKTALRAVFRARALYFLRTDIIERMVFRKLPKLKIAPSRSTQLYVDRFILS